MAERHVGERPGAGTAEPEERRGDAGQAADRDVPLGIGGVPAGDEGVRHGDPSDLLPGVRAVPDVPRDEVQRRAEHGLVGPGKRPGAVLSLGVAVRGAGCSCSGGGAASCGSGDAGAGMRDGSGVQGGCVGGRVDFFGCGQAGPFDVRVEIGDRVDERSQPAVRASDLDWDARAEGIGADVDVLAHERRPEAQALGRIVVARRHHHGRQARQFGQRPVDEPDGGRGRDPAIVDVARDEDRVDLVLADDFDDMAAPQLEGGHEVGAVERPAYMPVGRMENAHATSLSMRSDGNRGCWASPKPLEEPANPAGPCLARTGSWTRRARPP